MIDVQSISYKYGFRKPEVLTDFSLHLQEGGVYGLLGPNGAGKSTLLGLIAGTLMPTAGRVEVDGFNPAKRLPACMQDIFFVPEEFTLPTISLKKFLKLYSPFYPNFSYEDMRKHLTMFELDENINMGALSMGQKKKVFMCFALACNTKVLLMDEPTNGLDIPGKSVFRQFVAGSMNDDRIFLISTHQVRDVEQLLDHIIIMNAQKVLLNESVAKIQSALKFTVSTNPDVIQQALYEMPVLGGTSIILPNNDGSDTEIDLELLFNFATKQHEKINSILSSL